MSKHLKFMSKEICNEGGETYLESSEDLKHAHIVGYCDGCHARQNDLFLLRDLLGTTRREDKKFHKRAWDVAAYELVRNVVHVHIFVVHFEDNIACGSRFQSSQGSTYYMSPLSQIKLTLFEVLAVVGWTPNHHVVD